MTKKTLKFHNIKVNKKKFHMSKKAIDLMSVNVNKIVVSDKFNYNEDCFKYFIGYQKGEIVRPLCIILPQMNGYIKYFEYGSPNFLDNGIPKENMHYTCIACINIDSVMKMDEKYFPHVYLEEYKYIIKKIQMSTFINTELVSDSDSDDDSDTDSDSNSDDDHYDDSDDSDDDSDDADDKK